MDQLIHLLIILVIPLFIVLGILLLCTRRVNVPRSRQLHRPVTTVLGVLALVTATALCATEIMLFLSMVFKGLGAIEGRRSQAAEDARLSLKFGTAGMTLVGAFLLIGGLCAVLGARPKGARVERCRLVTNHTDRLMLLFIEPEGWDCWLRSGEAAELRAQAELPADDFVLADNPDGITAWPSQGMGRISVWQGGREVECGHQRPAGRGRGGRAEPLS